MFQLLTHTIQIPAVVLAVLDPFEITDRDTTGIGQNIGKHGDASFEQLLIGVRQDRAVGAFDDVFRFDVIDI